METNNQMTCRITSTDEEFWREFFLEIERDLPPQPEKFDWSKEGF